MSTTIPMPQLGETITEGTILRWAKAVGDVVAEGEVVLEISTDKVDTEIPSPVSGVLLEVLVEEGETVEVGAGLCVVGESSSDGASGEEPATEAVPSDEESAPLPAEEPPSPPIQAENPPSPAPSAPSGGPLRSRRMSPVVRRLVRRHGIDINLIAGTGEGGRVTRRDVEAYLGEVPTPAPAAPAPRPAAAVAASPVVTEEPRPPVTPVTPVESPADGRVDLSRLRARIGENMISSRRTAAHVWSAMEVDYEPIAEVRAAHKESFKQQEGFSLTYLPFVCRATIDALRTFPVVNSSFYLEEKKAAFHDRIHLGIAVDLNQEGLVVVTIKNAEDLRLAGLARHIRRLATAARERRLGPDELSGSTFTITNPGPFGAYMSAPIINVPNVAILSTDTVQKRPVVVTTPDGRDALAIRHTGFLGFSWDHRAFDGSTAVLFLQRIKNNLESWDWEQELK